MTASSFPRPTKHPDELLLLEFASGGLSNAESILISAHLALCPACRAHARWSEAVGGAYLSKLKPAHLPPNMLNRTLAAIDAAAQSGTPAPGGDVTGKAPPWRRLAGGYGIRRVTADSPNGRVWMVRAPAGKALLRHSHVGEEWTVVLDGGFHDSTGTYRKGDFVTLGDGAEHKPRAEMGEDCVCLVLVQGQPRYFGLVGRLMTPFLRL